MQVSTLKFAATKGLEHVYGVWDCTQASLWGAKVNNIAFKK
jgi:hypothetical protein